MKALFCIAIAVLAIVILARLVVKSAKSRNARMAGVVQGAYSFLADAMPQIVWTAKPDGNLDYSNRRWFDYTGMTIEETKNWGWKRVVHPNDVQNCIERWTKAFTTACDYEIEYRFKRAADGVYRWHLGRAFPLRNQSGEVVQWWALALTSMIRKGHVMNLKGKLWKAHWNLLKHERNCRRRSTSPHRLTNSTMKLCRPLWDTEKMYFPS